MRALENYAAIDVRTVQLQVRGLRHEIALAKDKRVSLDAAIKARENRLARLEAQLTLTGSTAQPASPMVAGR